MRHRRTRAGIGIVAAAAGAIAAAAPAAHALFSASPSASQDVATALLQPPTGVATAAGTCEAGVSDGAIVSWTPPSSTRAAGYEILRSTSSGGPYAAVGTVDGASASSFSETGLAFDSVYYYRVRSMSGEWRSADSTTAMRATRTDACT